MREWLRPFAEIAESDAAAEHVDGTPGTPRRIAGVPHNSLKLHEEHREHREHHEKHESTQASVVLRRWHRELVSIPDRPGPEIDTRWWSQAVDDACWIYENFAAQAVRHGWSELDLFGVLPAKPGWGGLTCRLRGARNLKMDRDRAIWTLLGVRDQFNRGCGEDLVKAGLIPLWELPA